MRKGKILHIRFVSFSEFKKAGVKALKENSPNVQKLNELFFSSPKVFEKFFSTQRLHLLAAVKALKPDSISELAKALDRDFGNVSRDCAALEKHGFLCLKTISGQKESKVPMLIFEYDTILVHLPGQLTYSCKIAA